MTRVGVLAVQGAFREHEQVLEGLGAECFEIRNRSDLDGGADALVIPGGESTVMGKLTRDLGILPVLRDMISSGTPVLGTCAGLIMLSECIEGGGQTHLATMPVTVRRNAYGRQLGSFSAEGTFAGMVAFPLEFIRAPMVTSVGEGVDVLCEHGGVPVAVRFGNQLGTAFHPELTSDSRVHEYFLDMARPHSKTRQKRESSDVTLIRGSLYGRIYV